MSCYLCKLKKPLKDSHILPQFIYKYLKTHSGSKGLYDFSVDTKIVQDGHTAKLFCDKCEGIIGRYENHFARNIFQNYVRDSSVSHFDYQEWLLFFVMSLAYRSILYALGNSGLNREQTSLLNELAEEYRIAIISQKHYGNHHIVFFRTILSSTESLPVNINEYLQFGVTSHPIFNNDKVLIFTKIPSIALFSFSPNCKSEWDETLIFNVGTIELPITKYNPDFMNVIFRNASDVQSHIKNLSPSLTRHNVDYFNKHISEFRKSKLYKMKLMDLALKKQ